MASTSFVVPGIGERPGVFGWLITRSFDDSRGRTPADNLNFDRSALTVGVYEDTAKSDMHDPGADVSFRL